MSVVVADYSLRVFGPEACRGGLLRLWGVGEGGVVADYALPGFGPDAGRHGLRSPAVWAGGGSWCMADGRPASNVHRWMHGHVVDIGGRAYMFGDFLCLYIRNQVGLCFLVNKGQLQKNYDFDRVNLK